MKLKEPRGEIKMDKKTLFEAGFTTLAGKPSEEELKKARAEKIHEARKMLAEELAGKVKDILFLAREWGFQTIEYYDDMGITQEIKSLCVDLIKVAAKATKMQKDLLES